jgi:peptidyl-prolyl cis-trans isomerase D
MAVLQKIRNKGILLVSIIALALALFIIGDMLRGGESLLNQARQTVGEIDGKSVSIQEYQDFYDQFQTFMELSQQKSSFTEDEQNRIKDMAWQTLVQNKIYAKECEELGVAVTNNEIAEVIRSGASQFLQVPAFMNQQGQYDYNVLQMFVSQYKQAKEQGQQLDESAEKLYKYYLFAQEQIRYEYLSNKLNNLIGRSFLSNKVEAKADFENRSNESNVLVVSLPFTSIKDDEVKVSDDEIAANYKKDKKKYEIFEESRDVKILDVQITASTADKQKAESEMQTAYKALAAAGNEVALNKAVRESNSLIPYSPVYKKADAFPAMISSKLNATDSASMAVGTTTKPAYDAITNTYYTVKLINKIQQADSVLYRQIGIAADASNPKSVAQKADSIVNQINAGSKFKDLAAKYNQTGDSIWIATAQYQNAQLDDDNSKFISALYDMSVGETRKEEFANGSIVVLQVLKASNAITKYQVAAIVKELKFSDDTYTAEYNKLSQFLANNNTLEKLEANAPKNGYTIRPASIQPSLHNIAGINNTREALKWAFDTAKPNQVSTLYECGNNDHLLILALTAINEKGYASLDKVKEIVKQNVINEKKADMLLAKAKDAKSLANARKITGALVDSLNHVTFANPTHIPSLGVSEPVIGALAAKTAVGKLSNAVKGNSGVYMVQVLKKSKTAEKYDEKTAISQSGMNLYRNAYQSLFSELYLKAKVTDTRYKFF